MSSNTSAGRIRILVAHTTTTASTLALVLIGTCLVIGPLSAHGVDSPARLREDEESIESNLRVPDGLEWGRYDVHCEVRVLSSGIPFDVTCYTLASGVPKKLVDAIRRAAQRAKFIPARRDGKPAQVYMVLMVRTAIGRGGPLVLVLPNNGVEHKRYGLFYIAPQRFNEFSWGAAYQGAPPDTLIWQKLWIDEHGNVTKSQTTDASGARVRDVAAVRRSVENMQFMPGFFEGKPAPMRYVEPAFASGK
jgi:hypothetical protein